MSKILIDKATVKLALEALELNNDEWKSLADSGDSGYWKAEDQDHYQQTNKAIAALREALADQPVAEDSSVAQAAKQPAQQEPVGEVVLEGLIGDSQVVRFHMYKEIPPVGAKLYESPPQRTWVGLSDEEIRHINRSTMSLPIEEVLNSFARAIEAKLKEKNT